MILRDILWSKWQIGLIVLTILLNFALISGCSTGKSVVFVRSSEANDTAVDANELAPFSGVLVSYGRYEYFLRCENHVEQEGVTP